MTKREFLAGLGTAAGVTVGQPLGAWAQRVLGGPRGPDDVGVPGQRSAELHTFLGTVVVGAHSSHGGLRVFWLHGAPALPLLPIATLEEARERGDLTLTERERAAVPSLVADNRGKRHILLLAGEILVGGKQNRVVSEDVLLRPFSGPVDLHVYCVEQGRWHGGGEFTGSVALAAPRLRSTVMEGRGQGEVWAGVQRYARGAEAPSPTGNYQAIQDKPDVQAHQVEAERALGARTAPGALGAAVFAAGAFTGLDLFQDQDLFARQWPKLLRAHALETYRRPWPKEADELGLRALVRALLDRARSAEGTLRRGADVGRLFEFRIDRRRGSALIGEGRVVHAAIL